MEEILLYQIYNQLDIHLYSDLGGKFKWYDNLSPLIEELSSIVHVLLFEIMEVGTVHLSSFSSLLSPDLFHFDLLSNDRFFVVDVDIVAS
ncbi:hypothetical protein Belba_1501 [Belliella baltica DSM 15883]|uniref:Uncharacterized protein n=1 Tax=Belliella baltica (strain DSM 15883 / CIP 108006 / LMG 21964 / BA134) TaxID=866536 RepID=I3Z4E7_BELBD|nr:hypothetical protein [Belliella baltica]AFL84115.1 hypothetical protein Belba_1501 [Belliella baltica DSM 15883]